MTNLLLNIAGLKAETEGLIRAAHDPGLLYCCGTKENLDPVLAPPW